MNQNFDSAELSKFTDLAHRWWDPHSEFGPLHQINPLRLDWIESGCALSGKQVLDVGCGGGILTESMAKRADAAMGIDLGVASLQVAQLHAIETQTHNVSYREISAEALALERPESFDVVTCMEMLEHVPDPNAIVSACARLVKPGGWVFFSTINRTPKAFLHAVVGAEYVLRLLPRGTHEYAKFIRPAELMGWARAANLVALYTRGMGYNPLSKRYALNDKTDVNYLIATQKQSSTPSQ